MDFKNGTATFIVPHWSDDSSETLKYFNETINSIFNQTDQNWQIVIIDDFSTGIKSKQYLYKLENKHPDKIKVLWNDMNHGPGFCRNLGIKWAYKKKSPFILFNDADDISHPKRLEESRRIFVEDNKASVIYSTFTVIDENNNIVPKENTVQCIIEILDGHEKNPPQGPNAWIDIGTEKGYTNLTSTTNVKTELAYKYLFPNELVSEDTHTWLRYSAGGDNFVFSKRIPSLYRIPQNTDGTSTISRIGSKYKFFKTKARVDLDGFIKAIEIALKKKKISPEIKNELIIKFHIKLAETFYKEKEYLLVKKQIDYAKKISIDLTFQIIHEKGLDEWDIF